MKVDAINLKDTLLLKPERAKAYRMSPMTPIRVDVIYNPRPCYKKQWVKYFTQQGQSWEFPVTDFLRKIN